ncbi:hypothetical protein [Methylobacterium trifolii]|uniref:Uncharacterized protein n=1 Tax=Methylobacterium trifolii TaxID=1003092 RepID=A0ABQ4U5D4_9HYPH|nr:hypothetical protein [Methylobacterium trifolii]GJE62654.1 hypothetical protein MPOCJGCO_4788 [Methylobacterium trifolii]
MSDGLFAAFDIGLVFALAFGLALWQLVAVRRSIRRDRTPRRTAQLRGLAVGLRPPVALA